MPNNVAALAEPTERWLNSVLAKEPDPALYVLWILLAATGMRPSEARTLLWAEMEEREDGLWIRKAAAKTPEGKKPIPVPTAAAEALRSLRRASLFVFPSPRTEHAYDETTIRAYWADAIARAELPEDINLYQLRHLFGTVAARKHKDHVLKRLMRHTDVRTTKQYYVEEDEEELRRAVDG